MATPKKQSRELKQHEKHRDLYRVGKPSIDHLSKEDGQVFCSSLLSLMCEYYKDQKRDE